MKSGKLFVIYGLIVVIGIAIAAAGYAMGGNSSLYISREDGLTIPEQSVHVLEIDEPLAFETLIVDVSTADVTIKGGDAFSLVARYEDGNEPIYTLDNDVLTVTEKREPDSVMSINFGILVSKTNKVTITLPIDTTYQRVTIVNRVGLSSVRAVQADQIEIDGKTGDVVVEELDTKTLKTGATTGAIRVRDVTADSAVAKTRVGDITLTNFVCDTLEAETNTGSIYADNAQAEVATLNGAVGDITLTSWTSNGLTVVNRTGSVIVRGTIRGVNALETNVGDIRVETSLAKSQYTVTLNTKVGDVIERSEDKMAAGATAGDDNHTLSGISRTGSVIVEYAKEN